MTGNSRQLRLLQSTRFPFAMGVSDAMEKLRSIRDFDTTGKVEGGVGVWSNEWALSEAETIGFLGKTGNPAPAGTFACHAEKAH